MKLTKNNIVTATALCLIILGTAVTVATAGAASDRNPNNSRAYLHSYNINSTGLAIEGYCPVTYFTDNKAVPGNPGLTATHNGVDYRFASQSAKQAFESNPEHYIPAYGGWCAFGMAIQDKFPVDPTNFKIVDGRLMLFLRNVNLDARERWNQGDEASQVESADSHWKKVSG
jgi:YHS domain-containing protein